MTNQNGIKDHGHCYRCFSTLIQLLRLRNFNRMLSLLLIRRRGRLLGRLGCGLIWRSCICCRFWRWIGWSFRRIGFIFRCIGLCFSCLICCPNTRCRILDENFSKKKLVTKYQNTHGPSKNASQNAYINDPKLHIERILSRSQIKRRGQKTTFRKLSRSYDVMPEIVQRLGNNIEFQTKLRQMK